MSKGGPRPDGGRRKHFRFVIDGRKYNSVEEASAGEGVVVSTISKWCHGRREGCYLETLDGKKVINKSQAKKTTKAKPKAAKKPKPTSPDAISDMLPTTDRQLPSDIINEAADANMTPLDYMLKVMRDSSAETDRRDKMAYWAAPYVHSKGNEKPGKKEEREEKAAKAASGKFAAGKPPLSLVKGVK